MPLRWTAATRVAAAVALTVLGPAAAAAHAFLDRSEPRAGSTVKTPPAEVKLSFTERLEPAYSTATVMTEKGDRVDRGDARVDGADRRVIRVSLPPLPAGTYKVVWRVLSVDAHVTEGDFTFRIAPVR